MTKTISKDFRTPDRKRVDRAFEAARKKAASLGHSSLDATGNPDPVYWRLWAAARNRVFEQTRRAAENDVADAEAERIRALLKRPRRRVSK